MPKPKCEPRNGWGIQATFRTESCIDQLIAQLRLGIPIPVGWLHRGQVSAPSGGGHWSLVVGWDPRTRQVLMHDPNGEADLVDGSYVSTAIGRDRASGIRSATGGGAGWWRALAPSGGWSWS